MSIGDPIATLAVIEVAASVETERPVPHHVLWLQIS